ncbi:MAG: cytochrome c oxidase subunit II [Gammaproteobacteria bacterium]|nr:cytochrome c oxidase subunit II [Gammaproteobacteria bacterium]MDJ0871050.1 cytochrome c oxidase subunit II [Gammaproteobacteria bacterium]
MSTTKTKHASSGLVALVTLLASHSALAEWGLNMTQGVTSISRQLYGLHMLVLWICVIIGIGVFGAIFYSIYHHRKSRGAKAAEFHESTTVEVIWTVVPFLILVGVAIPATKTLLYLEDTRDADINIKVTGYQWKWKYDYLDEDISFFSNLAPTSREAISADPTKVENYLLEVDNPIVVPVNKKVRFLITADDVIHAWWIPEFGVKQDAIPGFINDAWAVIEEPGVYRGQCAELCGKDHGYMPIVVEAKSETDYLAWVAEQKATAAADAEAAGKTWSMDELMAKGETVYITSCAACHQANGEGLTGVFPAIKGSPIATEDLPAHLDIILNGKAGTSMQAFGAQLTDTEIAAVITYQRNAWGNNTGEMVQPTEIKAAR